MCRNHGKVSDDESKPILDICPPYRCVIVARTKSWQTDVGRNTTYLSLYIYLSIYLSLSLSVSIHNLSLSLYIYIYIYTYTTICN